MTAAARTAATLRSGTIRCRRAERFHGRHVSRATATSMAGRGVVEHQRLALARRAKGEPLVLERRVRHLAQVGDEPLGGHAVFAAIGLHEPDVGLEGRSGADLGSIAAHGCTGSNASHNPSIRQRKAHYPYQRTRPAASTMVPPHIGYLV